MLTAAASLLSTLFTLFFGGGSGRPFGVTQIQYSIHILLVGDFLCDLRSTIGVATDIRVLYDGADDNCTSEFVNACLLDDFTVLLHDFSCLFKKVFSSHMLIEEVRTGIFDIANHITICQLID